MRHSVVVNQEKGVTATKIVLLYCTIIIHRYIQLKFDNKRITIFCNELFIISDIFRGERGGALDDDHLA